MSKRDRVTRWAQFCSEKFAIVAPGVLPPLHFVCPLCLDAYRPNDRAALSVEDVPPKSVGGRPMTVTCRRCNNRAGTEIERHTATDEQWAGWATEGDTLGKMRVGPDLWANVTLGMRDGAFHVNFVEEHNSPETRSAYLEKFSVGTPDQPATVNMEFDSYRPLDRRIADLGWLKAAYLTAFAAFGYSAILSPNYALLRDQLRRPDEVLIERYMVHRDERDDFRGIAVLKGPEPLRGCIVVQMGVRAIFLPAPFEPSDPYAHLADALGGQDEVPVHTDVHIWIEWPDRPVMQFDDGRFEWSELLEAKENPHP